MDHIAGLLKDSAKMPGLQVVISMDPLQDPLANGQKNASQSAMAGSILRTFAKDKGILLYDWDEVEAIGSQFPRKHTPPEPSDIYTICYTSGTTGMPVRISLLQNALLVFGRQVEEHGLIYCIIFLKTIRKALS